MKKIEHEKHDQETRQYLEEIGERYVFDSTSGLYRHKPTEAENDRSETIGRTKDFPWWVEIKRDWLIIILSSFTLLLLTATVFYTRRQWLESNRSANASEQSAAHALSTLAEIQKQTTLMQDQTIGTQGAILEFDPSLSVPAIVTAVRAFPGRVPAKNVEVTLTAQRIYLPSKKPIGSPVKCNISVPQVAETQSPNLILLSGSMRGCYLPNFSQAAMDEIMFTRQSVTISGSFTYDNGFGQVFRQEFCRTYLGYSFTGFINGDPKHPTGGEDASFHMCSDFDGALRRALEFKKKYRENYLPRSSP